MNLKEQILRDTAVFLNMEEFGEELTIDGVPTVGIWDDTASELSGTSATGIHDVNTFGLLAHTRTLYVHTVESMPQHFMDEGLQGIILPSVTQLLTIEIKGNFNAWEVLPGTSESNGIIKIILQQVTS